MGGRSVVVRMPGGAAHTYGMALTGRLAVYAGVCAPSSSSGIGNGSSTSNGASPCTCTRQPVGRRSHAGSTSGVQYQLAVNLTTGSPALDPTIVVRCAATVPAGRSPAASAVSWRAAAISPAQVQSSVGRPAASASNASGGRNSASRYEARLVSKPSIGRPKPICANSMCGESRFDKFAYSSISIASTRRCIERSASGSASVMNPGLLPVA